jgi:hypothetical protein
VGREPIRPSNSFSREEKLPRIRYLKPEFFTDEELCNYPFETRLLFAGLWCHADKAGRLEYRPKFLKAMIFPYDKIEIEKELIKLSEKPFISFFEVENKEYIQIVNWDKHQRPHHTEKESEISPMGKGKGIEKGMGKGKGKQDEGSRELRNGELTVKERLNSKFEMFWNEYPKKISKSDAIKSWNKINPQNGLFEKIIEAIKKQKQSEQWTKDNGNFIPYPTTWINGRRWEDELPQPHPMAGLNHTQRSIIESERRARENERSNINQKSFT